MCAVLLGASAGKTANSHVHDVFLAVSCSAKHWPRGSRSSASFPQLPQLEMT